MRSPARILPLALIPLALVGFPAPLLAQEAQTEEINYIDLLITRSPSLDRKLELAAQHMKGDAGRTTQLSASLSWSFFSRLQFTLQPSLVINDPRGDPLQVGAGDVYLEGEVLLWKSAERPAMASFGIGLTVPSGSARRGLGGDTIVNPYLTAGIGLGPFYLIGEVNYAWTTGGPEAGTQTFNANGAFGYKAWRWIRPRVELNLVYETRGPSGAAGDNGNSLVGRPQLYITPGIAIPLTDRASVRAGVQLPVTGAQEFDYNILAIFGLSFD